MNLYLGRNAQQCWDSYGLSLYSIHAVCNKLAWSFFYCNSKLAELDKIQTIKELLCVKYGLISYRCRYWMFVRLILCWSQRQKSSPWDDAGSKQLQRRGRPLRRAVLNSWCDSSKGTVADGGTWGATAIKCRGARRAWSHYAEPTSET